MQIRVHSLGVLRATFRQCLQTQDKISGVVTVDESNGRHSSMFGSLLSMNMHDRSSTGSLEIGEGKAAMDGNWKKKRGRFAPGDGGLNILGLAFCMPELVCEKIISSRLNEWS
jgi:hypothetical protein